MDTLRHKVKQMALDTLRYVARAYFQQRERELRSSRDKWKKKAMDRQSTIQGLEQELRQTRDELKKTDPQ